MMENEDDYPDLFLEENYRPTEYETVSVILPIILCTFISTSFPSCRPAKRYFMEFFAIVAPSVLVFTVLVGYVHEILLVLFLSSVTAFFMSNRRRSGARTHAKTGTEQITFLSNVRASINFLTAIAILAVDFDIFPRRFGKTDTYGLSLMDLGVGLFIYASGIVTREVASKRTFLIKTGKHSLILLVLGCARWFLTAEINYHVPVFEYGVHWNFFITLAVTKVLTALLLAFVDIKHTLLAGVLLLASHECLLQYGLKDFVFSDEGRSGFLLANREGIVSVPGYLSLHLLSIYLGRLLRHSPPRLLPKLMLLAGALLATAALLQHQFDVSRRLTNSSYCFWILFIGVFMTGLFYSCELLRKDSAPLIFLAINYNGLVFFVLSNLLTGVINIIRSGIEDVSAPISLLILFAYMFATTGLTCVLYSNKIRLKL